MDADWAEVVAGEVLVSKKNRAINRTILFFGVVGWLTKRKQKTGMRFLLLRIPCPT